MSGSVSKRDLLLGLLVIMAWAGNATALKFITLDVEPFTGLTIRLIIGSIVFLPFLRWPGKDKFWLVVQIIFLLVILHWSSLIWAVDKLEASMSAILFQMQVIFATLIGVFIFKEKIGWKTMSGIAIGISGIIVLVGMPQTPPSIAGVLVMTFSMLAFAASYARMKGLKDISPLNYTAYMHLLPLIPIAAITLLIEKPLETDWQAINLTPFIGSLIYQIIIVSGAHMIWQRLMTRNAMSSLPNLALLLPIFGVAFAMLFLGDKITPSMLAGGLVTMIGVGIIMLRKQKKIKS